MSLPIVLDIQRKVAQDFNSSNPILGNNEIGYELDTFKSKLGDKVNPWNKLEYSKLSLEELFEVVSPGITASISSGQINQIVYTSTTVTFDCIPESSPISTSGTVTSVGISGANGINVASSPITTSGTIALSLGAITPTSVVSSGTISGTNLSGSNTGDNAVNTLYSGFVSNATHTGDATGSTALTVVRINGVALSGLATGILKNTTTTGVPSIAVAADFPTLNQNTTGNAATVTTNANLTGPITSSGNATSIASQTGTGSTFVMSASPTITSCVIAGIMTGVVVFAPSAATSGSPTLVTVTGPAHTNLTLSTEASDINFNLGRTVQFATGALTTQRAIKIAAPTYDFVGASTLTNAHTVSISGAPGKGTNATLTNTTALNIESAAVGAATSSYGMIVNAQSGATTNYTAALLGGSVGIGTSVPTATFNLASVSSNSLTQCLVENHSNNNTPASIAYAKSRGTKASPVSVVTTDYIGQFLFAAADSANTIRQIGSFGVRANGSIGSNSVPSEMWFGVTPGWNSTNPFGDGTIQMLLSADTTVAINSTVKGTAQFNVFTAASVPTRPTTILRGAASQTADILQCQTSTPTNVFAVGIAGDLTTSASIIYKRTATATNYTILVTDYLIGVTSTAAARTITLPTAVSVTGKWYIVKDESGGAATNNITVNTTASQTIDGAATKVINTNYGNIKVYSDGANWFTV